ncbi:MAG TPA: SDR family oxidoreductase [Usitatibacter sp.]|nr:SDR family oxidoreductase [Usitatibacter sp.]
MLAGKTAVVTGATGPAALAVVRALLEERAQVALVDVDAMRLDSLVRFLRGTTCAVPCDSTDAEAVREAHQKIEKVLGPVDILVNGAEAPPASRIDTTDAAEWRRVTAAHLDGAYYWSRAVIPGMRKRNDGRIVNVLSLAAKSAGAESGAALAAAHGGLASLTFALARETAAQGITVNAVAVGAVEGSRAIEPLNEAQRRQLLASIPVGRFCKPEEFAYAVRFLVSPLAGFITGEILDVNGGVQMD